MKKLLITAVFISSFNAQAFSNFNHYGSGYDNNNWPIWTPMFWVEKATDNRLFGNQRYPNYGYNNRPYYGNYPYFDVSQMPTPEQTYPIMNNRTPLLQPAFTTPAAQALTDFDNSPQTNDVVLPNPYPAPYQLQQQANPYPAHYQFKQPPSPYSSWF